MTGIVIGKGTRFHSPLADAVPLWEVTKRKRRGVWEARVVNEPIEIDGKTYDGDFAGRVDLFTEEAIVRSIAVAQLAGERQRVHDGFYASLKVGQIVHYDNGFREFVRCEVVIGMTPKVLGSRPTEQVCLQPIALVGPGWARCPSHATFFIRDIREGRPFKPNVTCVWESAEYSPARKAAIDPRALPPLALELLESHR